MLSNVIVAFPIHYTTFSFQYIGYFHTHNSADHCFPKPSDFPPHCASSADATLFSNLSAAAGFTHSGVGCWTSTGETTPNLVSEFCWPAPLVFDLGQ